jgi:hypothetical protein
VSPHIIFGHYRDGPDIVNELLMQFTISFSFLGYSFCH